MYLPNGDEIDVDIQAKQDLLPRKFYGVVIYGHDRCWVDFPFGALKNES